MNANTRNRRSPLGACSLLLLLVAALTACLPVTPSVEFGHSTFEGFPVISYVPDQPRGLVVVFHGVGGDASFAESTETMDVLNLFIAAGYGFVSTESTDRSRGGTWDTTSMSPTSNLDLARLGRLHANLVSTTGLESTTPLVGIGMSGGGRMVTLWGQAAVNGGYPVKAVWASASRIAPPVTNAGGLTVPTFFSVYENDTTIPPQDTIDAYEATVANGTPAMLRTSLEKPLSRNPYLRIDGIDGTEADAIVAAAIATGVWDASGTRIVPNINTAINQARTADLPASVLADGLEGKVAVQTNVILAAHNFSAEYKIDAFTFMDGFVSSTPPSFS